MLIFLPQAIQIHSILTPYRMVLGLVETNGLSCTVKKIRDTFPSESYVGFKYHGLAYLPNHYHNVHNKQNRLPEEPIDFGKQLEILHEKLCSLPQYHSLLFYE